MKPGQTQVSPAPFYGTGNYRPGESKWNARIFDSRIDALKAIKAAARAEGLVAHFLDFQWKGGLPAELRPEAQREALEIISTWMQANNRKTFDKNDFGHGPDKIRLDEQQIFAYGSYSQGRPHYENRIFDSRTQFLIELKRRLQDANFPIELVDFHWPKGFSEEVRREIQMEAAERVVKWIVEHDGAVPRSYELGLGPGQVNLYGPRLFGLNLYSPGQSLAELRIYDSRADGVKAIIEAARKKNIVLRLSDFDWRNPPPEILLEIQQEVIDKIVDWIEKNGRAPSGKDFAEDSELGSSQARIFGSGHYRDGERHAELRLFDSKEDAVAAIIATAKERGIRVRYLDFRWSLVTDSLRAHFQREAVEIVREWMAANSGRLPKSSDFSTGSNDVNLYYSRFVGSNVYGPDGDFYESRIFNSREEAFAAVQTEASQ